MAFAIQNVAHNDFSNKVSCQETNIKIELDSVKLVNASTLRFAKLLGKRIRTLRLSRDLTLERLAWESGDDNEPGVTKGYLSKIEQGSQLPSLQTLLKIADRLDVEPFQLLVFPTRNAHSMAVDLLRQLSARKNQELVGSLRKHSDPEE